ncbi:hypothetical protein L6386_00935 [bacterium]|nr:hypothetical protein [bacterium]MBU4560721.1 hypothetical protein [bacterium]MCG2675941.1 hypothetical protein [bacterium]MCG2677122.1 hypothetical protein [bacterium]
MKRIENSLYPEDWKKVAKDNAIRYNSSLESFRGLCERVSGYYFAERYPRLVASKLTCRDVEKDMEEAKRFIKALTMR